MGRQYIFVVPNEVNTNHYEKANTYSFIILPH
jgi:hypothetical protein